MSKEWIPKNESGYSQLRYRKYEPLEFKATYIGIIEKLDRWPSTTKTNFARLKPIEKIWQGANFSAQFIDVFETETKYQKPPLKPGDIILVKGYFWEFRAENPKKKPYLNILKISHVEE